MAPESGKETKESKVGKGKEADKGGDEEFEDWPPPWKPNTEAKIALVETTEDLDVLIKFQEKAGKLLDLCGGIGPIALDYDKLLKAKGYEDPKIRTAFIAEQAVWWGYKKGIDKVGELTEALKPVFEAIPGIAALLLKKGK